MFSTRTIAEAALLLENKTKSEILSFYMRYDLEKHIKIESNAKTIPAFISYMKQLNESEPQKVGEIIIDLIEECLESLERLSDFSEQNFEKKYSRLNMRLYQDGYIKVGEKLQLQQPPQAEPVLTQSALFALLDKHNFQMTKGHLLSALDNHAEKDWPAANSQFRTFFESMVEEIAICVYGDLGKSLNTNNRFQKLSTSNPPLFSEALNESGDNGKNFLTGFWKRLHAEGSHPGISNEIDCTFRLQIVTATALYYMRIFDNGIRPS